MALGLALTAFASSVSAAPYTFTTLVVPGARFTDASGINNAGQVVGVFSDSRGVFHGFINTGGTFTTLDVPGAGETDAFGINNAGQVVGFFGDSGGQHGFINTGSTFTTLDVPGASLTGADGINNAGQVVGGFSDSSGDHGFVASPVPLPAAVWLLGTTLGGLGFVRRRLV